MDYTGAYVLQLSKTLSLWTNVVNWQGLRDTVEAVWSINCNESWDTRVLRKFESCGAALTKWSTKSFGSVKKQLEFARKWLKTAENQAIRSGDSSRMRLLEDEDNQLLDKEAKMWRQRSKVAWLRDGDRNTRFFHSTASQRRRRNYITKLHDANGGWCSS